MRTRFKKPKEIWEEEMKKKGGFRPTVSGTKSRTVKTPKRKSKRGY